MLILLPTKWMADDSSESRKKEKKKGKIKKMCQAADYCTQCRSDNA